jgi:flagellar biosynthesis protein FliR
MAVAAAALGAELEMSVLAVGLGAARTLPVAWMVPALGGPHVPAVLRLGLGVALAILCLPRLAGQVPAGGGAVWWTVLLAREVMVGVTLGFVAGALFRAAEAAGRLTDMLRGANLAEALAPSSDERSSPLGEITGLLAVVIFLELGGLGHLATALALSYDAVPLVPAASIAPQLGGVAALVLQVSARLIEAAVGLAAPALVALLLADLALGAIGRAAPQIPLYFVGMPLKALLGVGVVLLGLGALHAALVAGFGAWRPLLDRAIEVWR